MWFLILMGALVLFSAMIRNSAPTGFTGRNAYPVCPPHKWLHNDYGRLKCNMCNKYTEDIIK